MCSLLTQLCWSILWYCHPAGIQQSSSFLEQHVFCFSYVSCAHHAVENCRIHCDDQLFLLLVKGKISTFHEDDGKCSQLKRCIPLLLYWPRKLERCCLLATTDVTVMSLVLRKNYRLVQLGFLVPTSGLCWMSYVLPNKVHSKLRGVWVN